MQLRQEDDGRLRTAGRVGFQCHRCTICREDAVLVNRILEDTSAAVSRRRGVGLGYLVGSARPDVRA